MQTIRKFRAWIPGEAAADNLMSIEKRSNSYTAMGVDLLSFVFNAELQNAKKFCCTPSKDRELLDQIKLKGIRCKNVCMIRVTV